MEQIEVCSVTWNWVQSSEYKCVIYFNFSVSDSMKTLYSHFKCQSNA